MHVHGHRAAGRFGFLQGAIGALKTAEAGPLRQGGGVLDRSLRIHGECFALGAFELKLIVHIMNLTTLPRRGLPLFVREV